MVKNLPANAGYTGNINSIPRSGRSPGVGNGKPLQYSYLGNPQDREMWQATVQGVTKSQTRLKQLRTHLRKQEDERDMSSIPGSGRSPGVGNGNPLPYSSLKNPMER